MSFSAETKDELARITPEKRCCQLAELSALFRMDGALQISSFHKVSLTITTESAAVARKIFRLVKQIFDIQTEIVVQRKRRLKKNNVYSVTLPAQQDGVSILEDLGLVDAEGNFTYGLKESLPTKECDRRAYLRGAFLGGGSVNNPEGTYHLEIILGDEEHAEALVELMGSFGLQAKISQRKNWFVVYLKESEQIVDFLSIIGAHKALLNFENVRIVKEMRNQVNRLVNCETANLNKTVNASVRQVENIHFIQERMGLDKLPRSLKEMAELRLQYPDASLKELGEMLNPPVGKSGVNHRLRKLEELADQLRGK